MFVG
jgi:hypothetical protein